MPSVMRGLPLQTASSIVLPLAVALLLLNAPDVVGRSVNRECIIWGDTHLQMCNQHLVTVHVPAGRHLVFGSPHYAIAATFSEMPAQTDPVQHTAMTALEFQTTFGNSVKVEIPTHDTIMNLVVQLNGAIIFPGYSKTDTTEPDGNVTVALSEDSHLVTITAPHISIDVKLENLWRHKRADENDRLFAHFDVDGAGPMIGFLGESMYEPTIPSPMLRAPKTVMPSQVLDDLQDLKYAIASGWCYTSVPEATQLPWGTVACSEV